MLSPSTLNLYEDCPRCFWLKFRKDIKRPDCIFPSLPSGMDRILKEHFDKYAKQGKLPPELKELKEVKVFNNKELLDKWRNWREGISYTENGNVLKGAVDAILQKGEKLIVLDYKTRGYPRKENTHEYYKNQLNLYTFLLRKNNYETEDYAYLLFYHPDKVVDDVFLFHSDLVKVKVDVKSAENLWKNALKTLEGAMPEASTECQHCPYRGVKINTNLLDY